MKPERQAREPFRHVAEQVQRTLASEAEGKGIRYTFLGELGPSAESYTITIRLEKEERGKGTP